MRVCCMYEGRTVGREIVCSKFYFKQKVFWIVDLTKLSKSKTSTVSFQLPENKLQLDGRQIFFFY